MDILQRFCRFIFDSIVYMPLILHVFRHDSDISSEFWFVVCLRGAWVKVWFYYGHCL